MTSPLAKKMIITVVGRVKHKKSTTKETGGPAQRAGRPQTRLNYYRPPSPIKTARSKNTPPALRPPRARPDQKHAAARAGIPRWAIWILGEKSVSERLKTQYLGLRPACLHSSLAVIRSMDLCLFTGIVFLLFVYIEWLLPSRRRKKPFSSR
jgi:hypothetical protein